MIWKRTVQIEKFPHKTVEFWLEKMKFVFLKLIYFLKSMQLFGQLANCLAFYTLKRDKRVF